MVNDIVTNDIAGFVRAHLSESGKFGMRLFEAVNSADVYWIISDDYFINHKFIARD